MKKIAFIGASARSRAFLNALKNDFADKYHICALMDVERGKMENLAEDVNIKLNFYTDFDELCKNEKPDLLLISSVDATHCEYIVKALDMKIDSLCEKPLCVSLDQCRQIQAARQRNPEVNAATLHNARYHIAAREIKRLLDSGTAGKITSVNYLEMLDYRHGASYFRRWNRLRSCSGGLQIHKSSHHFDKLNWWLDSHAVKVTATGKLITYGADASPFHGDNCQTCPHTGKCRFAIDYEAVNKHFIDFQLYLKRRNDNSYRPDGCVFSPEIDIEDFFTAGIIYANGVGVNYSLSAHCNVEGEHIVFEGTEGRLEYNRHTQLEGLMRLELYRFGEEKPETIALKHETGSHDGADNNLYMDVFGDAPPSVLATLEDGMQAVLIGDAINRSIASGAQADVQLL